MLGTPDKTASPAAALPPCCDISYVDSCHRGLRFGATPFTAPIGLAVAIGDDFLARSEQCRDAVAVGNRGPGTVVPSAEVMPMNAALLPGLWKFPLRPTLIVRGRNR